MILISLIVILLAYLLGAVSTAIITCRIMGLPDPRSVGSRNPGATNVLRVGNKKAAAITLVGDMLKGLVPMLVAHALAVPDWALAATGLAAFSGHVLPVYYGFQGGKGVATALGVLLGLHWLVGLLAVLTWLAVALTLRYSSLAALTAALLAPVFTFWLTAGIAQTVGIALMTLIIVWRHQGNIQRLWAGTESRIGASKT